jgi:hypothetical protein
VRLAGAVTRASAVIGSRASGLRVNASLCFWDNAAKWASDLKRVCQAIGSGPPARATFYLARPVARRDRASYSVAVAAVGSASAHRRPVDDVGRLLVLLITTLI